MSNLETLFDTYDTSLIESELTARGTPERYAQHVTSLSSVQFSTHLKSIGVTVDEFSCAVKMRAEEKKRRDEMKRSGSVDKVSGSQTGPHTPRIKKIKQKETSLKAHSN